MLVFRGNATDLLLGAFVVLIVSRSGKSISFHNARVKMTTSRLQRWLDQYSWSFHQFSCCIWLKTRVLCTDWCNHLFSNNDAFPVFALQLNLWPTVRPCCESAKRKPDWTRVWLMADLQCLPVQQEHCNTWQQGKQNWRHPIWWKGIQRDWEAICYRYGLQGIDQWFTRSHQKLLQDDDECGTIKVEGGHYFV